MKIIILPKDISEDLLNYDISEINSNELDIILNELKEIDSSVEISTVNFGRGADWILLLATLSSITSIISLGDKLEKGIDGWIKIGKRISKIFHNSDKVYIDEDLAKIMAISHISKNYDIKSIKLIDNRKSKNIRISKYPNFAIS